MTFVPYTSTLHYNQATHKLYYKATHKVIHKATKAVYNMPTIFFESIYLCGTENWTHVKECKAAQLHSSQVLILANAFM